MSALAPLTSLWEKSLSFVHCLGRSKRHPRGALKCLQKALKRRQHFQKGGNGEKTNEAKVGKTREVDKNGHILGLKGPGRKATKEAEAKKRLRVDKSRLLYNTLLKRIKKEAVTRADPKTQGFCSLLGFLKVSRGVHVTVI